MLTNCLFCFVVHNNKLETSEATKIPLSGIKSAKTQSKLLFYILSKSSFDIVFLVRMMQKDLFLETEKVIMQLLIDRQYLYDHLFKADSML